MAGETQEASVPIEPHGSRLGWLIGVALCLPVGFLCVSFWQSIQAAHHRTECKAHLKQIAAALHAYHDDYDSFPPAFVVGPDGERWHSWRTLLLPYLDENELHAAYRFDQPWDGPENRKLIGQVPEVYQCPACSHEEGSTNYFAIVDRRSMWPADQAVAINEVTDGTSNTVQVVEDPTADISWTSPVDLLSKDVVHRLQTSNPHEGGRFFAFVDGSCRFLAKEIDRSILASVITPKFGKATFQGDDWPDDLVVKSKEVFGSTEDISSFAATEVVASSRLPLDVQQTTLWCATFQMVWDELKDKVNGSDVQVSGESSLSTALNKGSFPRSALATECYSLSVTGVGDEATTNLIKEINDRFPGADPDLEVELSDRPGLRFFAYLKKSMPFASEFDRLDGGLLFRSIDETTHDVEAFGLLRDEYVGVGTPVRTDEVEILDYVNDSNFVLQLNTDGPQTDQIVLARISPGATLDECWADVARRIATPHEQHNRPHLMTGDSLKIPVMDFSLSTEFEELSGQQVLNLPSLPKRVFIEQARQSMQLRLDETGADFISASELAVVGEFGDFDETPAPPGQPRRFRLNQPFLIALRESDDQPPYFIGWIANADLMELKEN